jgi:DNA-binding beta-propeller fold protein YncE
MAAVSLPERRAVALLDAHDGRLLATTQIGGEPSGLSFRRDGKVLLMADRAQNAAVIVDVASRRVAVRLPLGLRPDFLCVNSDGGQVFLTGEGLDAVVAVYPYRTEVGSTMLAGRAPGVMAVSASGLLFVANPPTSTVTILSIATQRLMAAVNVGRNPCHISITPDGEYALVLNKDSGDMSVLHIPTISGRRTRAAALLTDIPVGSAPVSAAVRLV